MSALLPSPRTAGATAPVRPDRALYLALAAVLATDELEHMVCEGDDGQLEGLEDVADHIALTCGCAACYPLAFAELFAELHIPMPDYGRRYAVTAEDIASTYAERAAYVPGLAARVRPAIAAHRDFLARQGNLALVFG